MKTISKLIIFTFLVTLFACAKDNNSEGGNDPKANPVFSVKMVDAPSVFDAVNVEVLSMEANINGNWVEFPVENPGVYNLQVFTNGNSMLLIGDTSLAPGVMTELRLILGTNNSVVVDGITFELQTPSGQTSGYKIKMDQQILEPGGMYRLVIEFDVSVSVHLTGSGKYMLKPVVRGYLETAVGGIAGIIIPPAGAFYVEAVNTTDTSGTLVDQATGQFLIGTAFPGIYNVTCYANAGFSDTTLSGVQVIAGQTTQLGLIVME